MKKNVLTIIACVALLPLARIGHAQAPPPPPPPLAAVPASAASSDDKHVLILQLLDLIKLDQMAKTMEDGMTGSMQNSVGAMMSADPSFKSLTPAQRAKAIGEQKWVMNRFMELYSKQVDLKALITDSMLKLYDKYYTANEIKDMIAFYKSPTGQKTIEVMPKLANESMQMSVTTIMPKVQSIMKQVMSEEKKRQQ